jgi:hypothetical protein
MIDNKRHLDLLKTRLEEVVFRGYTRIRRFELYAWYGRERLTQNVFRHLMGAYHEIAGARQRLHVLTEEGAFLLVDPARLEPAATAFGIEEE